MCLQRSSRSYFCWPPSWSVSSASTTSTRDCTTPRLMVSSISLSGSKFQTHSKWVINFYFFLRYKCEPTILIFAEITRGHGRAAISIYGWHSASATDIDRVMVLKGWYGSMSYTWRLYFTRTAVDIPLCATLAGLSQLFFGFRMYPSQSNIRTLNLLWLLFHALWTNTSFELLWGQDE